MQIALRVLFTVLVVVLRFLAYRWIMSFVIRRYLAAKTNPSPVEQFVLADLTKAPKK